MNALHSYRQKRNGQIATVIELLNAFRFKSDSCCCRCWYCLWEKTGEHSTGCSNLHILHPHLVYTHRYVLATYVHPMDNTCGTCNCSLHIIKNYQSNDPFPCDHRSFHFAFYYFSLLFFLISAGMTAYSNSPIPASFACQCTSMA